MDLIIEDLDHTIAAPSEIRVEEIAAGLANVEVVDGAGRHRRVKFRSPLARPAP